MGRGRLKFQRPERGWLMYECEVRGFFADEQRFEQILAELSLQADRVEADNRETIFFMLENATLKVAVQNDKGKAKIAYKQGDIVRSMAQREIELAIKPEEAHAAVELFQLLGFTDIQNTVQKRTNLFFGDIEVAMKWSKDWGYHFEAETIVKKEGDVPGGLKKLQEFCEKQNLAIMSEEEFEVFRQKVDAQHRAAP